MPNFFASVHDEILNNFIESGKTKFTNNNRVVPVLCSNRLLRKLKIHIKLVPHLENGLAVFAVMKLIDKDQRLMLVSRDGVIEAFSESLANDLRLERYLPEASIYGIRPRDKNL